MLTHYCYGERAAVRAVHTHLQKNKEKKKLRNVTCPLVQWRKTISFADKSTGTTVTVATHENFLGARL